MKNKYDKVHFLGKFVRKRWAVSQKMKSFIGLFMV